MNLFKKKKDKEERKYFHVKWDEVDSAEDLENIMKHISGCSRIYASESEIKSLKLEKYFLQSK